MRGQDLLTFIVYDITDDKMPSLNQASPLADSASGPDWKPTRVPITR
jgi:hypothetical protein